MITAEQLAELEAKERAAWAEQHEHEKVHKESLRKWLDVRHELEGARREIQLETEVQKRLAERAQS